MSTILTFLAGIPLLLSGALFSDASEYNQTASVEVGVAELSPSGLSGGYAVPASNSSTACTITLTPSTIVEGSNTVSTWGPYAVMNATLAGVNYGNQTSGWSWGGALPVGSHVFSLSRTITGTSDGGCVPSRGTSCYTHTTTQNYSCSAVITVVESAAAAPDVDLSISPSAATASGVNYTATWTSDSSVSYSCLTERRSATWNGSSWSTPTGWTSLSTALNSSVNHAPTPSLTTEYEYRTTCTNDSDGGASTEVYETHQVGAARPNLTSLGLGYTGTLQQGQSVTFGADVQNNGSTGTGVGFTDEFSYRWGTSGSWIPFDTVAKSALASGATSADTSSSFSLTQTGTLQVQHCIDSTDAIDESDESAADNCSNTGSLTVSAPSPVCSDGLDNDGDGAIDYPNDPGCSSGSDTDETNPPDGTITDDAPPSGVDYGDTTEITWSTDDTSSCTVTSPQNSDNWSGTSGSETSSPLVDGSTTYVLICDGDDGSTSNVIDSTSITASAPADPSITSDTPQGQVGDPIELDWDSGDSTPGTCEISAPGYPNSGVLLGGSSGTVSDTIRGSVTYTLTCDLGSDTYTVEVIPTGFET